MMNKLVTLLTGAVLIACCDPNVDESFVLSHGPVRAQVECENKRVSSQCDEQGCSFKYKSTLFLDGSSVSSVGVYNHSPTSFKGRGEAGAEIGKVSVYGPEWGVTGAAGCIGEYLQFSVESGDMNVMYQKVDSGQCFFVVSESFSINDSRCSGFNLAAFGLN